MKSKKPFWGDKWILEEDVNNVKARDEKKGGRMRHEHIFVDFRNLISDMDMEEVKFQGHAFTWAKNRE